MAVTKCLGKILTQVLETALPLVKWPLTVTFPVGSSAHDGKQ